MEDSSRKFRRYVDKSIPSSNSNHITLSSKSYQIISQHLDCPYQPSNSGIEAKTHTRFFECVIVKTKEAVTIKQVEGINSSNNPKLLQQTTIDVLFLESLSHSGIPKLFDCYAFKSDSPNPMARGNQANPLIDVHIVLEHIEGDDIASVAAANLAASSPKMPAISPRNQGASDLKGVLSLPQLTQVKKN